VYNIGLPTLAFSTPGFSVAPANRRPKFCR